MKLRTKIVFSIFALAILATFIARAALQPVSGTGHTWFPEFTRTTGSGITYTTFTLNQTGTVAMVLQAPKAGDICTIGFMTGTETVTSTLIAFLGTASTTSGNPNGSSSLLATNSFVETSPLQPASTFKEWTLNASATVTASQIFVVGFSATNTAPSNFSMQMNALAYGNAGLTSLLPYTDNMITGAGTFAKNVSPLVLSLGYCDGSYADQWGYKPYSAATAIAYSSSSAWNNVGAKLTFPYPYQFDRVFFDGAFSSATSTTSTVFVYDAGNNIVASATVNPAFQEIYGNGPGTFVFPLGQTITAAKNSVYRIAFRNFSTINFNLQDVAVSGTALMSTLEMGTSSILTESTTTASGAVTTWNDSSTFRAFVGVGATGFDDAAQTGGGGGGAGFMSHWFGW